MTKPKTPKARGAKPKPSKPRDTPDTFDASTVLKNARHERFCQNVGMHGMNQGQAYTLAGFVSATPEGAQNNAARLMGDDRIKSRTAFLRARAAALAIDAAALNKADIINMTLEQHQRNIGLRPVTVTRPVKSGKDKGKLETIETYVYSEAAASQTLKMLNDEWGNLLGASGARGNDATTIDARAGRDDPTIVDILDGTRRARKLILAGGTDTAPAPKPPAEQMATLKKLAEGE